MRVKVRVLRQAGRLLRPEEQKGTPAFVGDLSVAEARDHELNRRVVRARLTDTLHGTGDDLLPELNDAHLLWARGDTLRLSGVEQIEDITFAQTWAVEVLGCSA